MNMRIPEQAKTILVVDDDEDPLQVIKAFLDGEGYKTVEKRSGYEAVSYLKGNQVDLVVSDVKMPNGTGIDLLNWIYANLETPPAVILITGFSDISTPEALNLGAENLLLKPVDPDSFLVSVKKALVDVADRWGSVSEENKFQEQINLNLPSLEKAILDGIIAFGRGGFFLHLKDRLPSVYGAVRFQINFESGDISNLSGSGVVRWSRETFQKGRPSGIGIEISSIRDECRHKISYLVRQKALRPFIPIGDGKVAESKEKS